MKIEIYADNLSNKDISKNRQCSARTVFVKEGKILLLHSKKYDYFTLPGGNQEINESLEETAIRETREETGYIVSVKNKTVTIVEYFPDATWESHYFLVEQSEAELVDKELNQEEIEFEWEVMWLNLEEALVLLDNHDSTYYKATNVMQREFLAIINSI
ncbi:MAG: NUDIX domain-containing protein [Candidatus Izemoplasmatales bacterium]